MHEREPSAFGVLLRRHRLAAGLTQEELSARAAISARTISDVERGIARRPQIQTALQLAEALRLDGQSWQQFLDSARGRTGARGENPQNDELLSHSLPGEPAARRGATTRQIRASLAERRAGDATVPTLSGSQRVGSHTGVGTIRRTASTLQLVAAATALAALVVAGALAVRARTSRDLPAITSTANRPVVIESWGTSITGPFPLAHMWALAVGPNGNVAVSTYAGPSDAPRYEGVAELSPSGALLWSYAGDARQFLPTAVTTDGSGSIYAIDQGARNVFPDSHAPPAIYKFSPNGRLVAHWGAGLGLRRPVRLALDAAGHVWVTDMTSGRLLGISSTGRLLSSYGGAGGFAGQFAQVLGLTIGKYGDIYTTDLTQARVTEFSPNGRPIRVWGGAGTAPGQFNGPRGLATDAAGNIYVADTGNARIQSFSPNGKLLAVWGGQGHGPGRLKYPTTLAFAPDGDLYVSDAAASAYCMCGPDRIVEFSRNGRFLRTWPAALVTRPILSRITGIAVDDRGRVYSTDGPTGRVVAFGTDHLPVAVWRVRDQRSGRAGEPSGIAVDSTGALVVVDRRNSRVLRFTPAGRLLRSWGSVGGGRGQMQYPEAVTTDGHGHIIVADVGNSRLVEFDALGRTDRSFPAPVTPGSAVASDAAGDVYLGNGMASPMTEFNPSGRYVFSWGSGGAGQAQTTRISGAAVDGKGRVYTVDVANATIACYAPSGILVFRWKVAAYPSLGISHPVAITLDRAGNLYIGGDTRIVEVAAVR